MSATTAVPVEEYLRTSYRPDRDYLEGEVRERNMGQWSHARVQGEVFAICRGNERNWGIRAAPEVRVQVKRDRFRVPDVVVLAASAPREEIITHPPVLCIEVLSEDDRASETNERVADYLAFGAPCVWVIDPRTRRAQIHTREHAVEVSDGFLRVPGTPVEVDLNSLFEGLG